VVENINQYEVDDVEDKITTHAPRPNRPGQKAQLDNQRKPAGSLEEPLDRVLVTFLYQLPDVAAHSLEYRRSNQELATREKGRKGPTTTW